MRTTPLLLAPLLLGMRSHDPATAVPVSDDLRELFAADEAFCAESREAGLDGWMRWFREDALLIVPGEEELVRGAAAVRQHYRALAWPAPGLAWKPERGGLSEDGAFGFTVGSWTLDGRPDVGGSYLTVWQREDGAWRVATDCGGSLAHRTSAGGAAPPSTLVYEDVERLRSAAGDLVASLGRSTVEAEGGATSGVYLTVWQRGADGGWTVAASIGS